jgi:hypothetical protein
MEGGGIEQDLAVDVGEHQVAAGGGAGAPCDGLVDGVLGQVVGDALPQQKRRELPIEAGVGERGPEVIPLEVHRDVPHGIVPARCPAEACPLRRLGGRVIDLEHDQVTQLAEAVGP